MIENISTCLTDPKFLKELTTLVDVILKLVIALIGFYLAHSLSRQVALRVSEKRLSAYSALWVITGVASPMRLEEEGAGPLTAEERLLLHDALAKWYYTNGNGMLLANGTRTVFLKVKDNLVLNPEKLATRNFKEEVLGLTPDKVEAIRGRRSIQQLSLLRTRMKADLGVYGIHYGGELKPSSKLFLIDCGEMLWRRPWRKPLWQYIQRRV